MVTLVSPLMVREGERVTLGGGEKETLREEGTEALEGAVEREERDDDEGARDWAERREGARRDAGLGMAGAGAGAGAEAGARRRGRAVTNGMRLAGGVAQRTRARSTRDWPSALSGLGREAGARAAAAAVEAGRRCAWAADGRIGRGGGSLTDGRRGGASEACCV